MINSKQTFEEIKKEFMQDIEHVYRYSKKQEKQRTRSAAWGSNDDRVIDVLDPYLSPRTKNQYYVVSIISKVVKYEYGYRRIFTNPDYLVFINNPINQNIIYFCSATQVDDSGEKTGDVDSLVAIYSYHSIDRLYERLFKCSPKGISDKVRMKILAEYLSRPLNYYNEDNTICARVEGGILLGECIGDNINVYKTYISEEQLRGDQVDNFSNQSDFNQIREKMLELDAERIKNSTDSSNYSRIKFITR